MPDLENRANQVHPIYLAAVIRHDLPGDPVRVLLRSYRFGWQGGLILGTRATNILHPMH